MSDQSPTDSRPGEAAAPALPALGLRPLTEADLPQIEKLDERAFGPGRFARSAYRLREGVKPDFELSFVAHVGTLLVGANMMTRIRAGECDALLLGPLTVDPSFRSRGIGEALMARSIARAREQGHRLVLLVGDNDYYARVGFRQVPAGKLRLPGPVDPARLLYCELVEGALEGASGFVSRA